MAQAVAARTRPSALSPAWARALLLLAAALAIRAAWFGDPVVQVDEEFYLLVGDRMLHAGALPYVDIWDRKPIGLFLVYAAIRLLGGLGVVQYQIVATMFAWATALVIARVADHVASPRAAGLAGLAYLLWLPLLGGQGGQSPVFYNLPVAAAALLTLGAWGERRHAARRALAAMALAGLALQLKYTTLFEGVFYGVMLLVARWRRGDGIGRLVPSALLWIAVALTPTVAAFAFYAARGHADAFLYANFVSIGARGGSTLAELALRLGFYGLVLLPLLAALAIARGGARDRRAHDFLLGWLTAAAAGLLLFGTYYNHYALPLLVPLCAALAPALDRVRRVPLLAALIVAVGVAGSIRTRLHVPLKRGDAAYAKAVTDAIAANLRGGCLYVYDGEPILYQLTRACTLTRYLFPNHLNQQLEAGAIGVDPAAELRAVLARRPAVIVDTLIHPRKRRQTPRRGTNAANNAILKAELARHYRLAASIPLQGEERRVWARRPD